MAIVQVKPIQQTTRDLLLPSIGQVRGSTNLTGSKGDKVWSGWVQDGVQEAERLLMQRHSLHADSDFGTTHGLHFGGESSEAQNDAKALL